MKRSLLLICSLLIVFVACAQPSLSLKGGLNLADMVRDNTVNMKKRLGVQFGLVAQQPISGKFFVQPELLYAGKGYRHQPPFPATVNIVRLNYLSLPLMLGYKASEKFSVLFGPEVDYLLAAVWDSENSSGYKAKGYSSFDAGLDLGLNYQISKKFGVDLRYNHGFHTFFYTDDAGVKYDDHKGANRVFQLGFIYRLK